MSLARTKVRTFTLGQVLSILITCTGYFSHNINGGGFSCPTLQSSLNYCLLALYCVYNAGSKLHAPWWRYLLLAIVDVEGNYLVVKSFQYTSTTSILLLDGVAIPCVMLMSVMSRVKAVYTRGHIFGAFICMLGLVITVICDTLSNGNSGAFPLAWKGDLLCLAGASLYALSNVLQEQLIKNHGERAEVLGMMGVFGCIISGIQASFLERHVLQELNWDVYWNILGYQLSLFAMYSLTSVFLSYCDACLFNLSLLTSDLYTMIIASAVWKQTFHPLYVVSYFVTMLGLVQYHREPTPTCPFHVAHSVRSFCSREPLVSDDVTDESLT